MSVTRTSRWLALLAALGLALGLVARSAQVEAQPAPGDKDPSRLPLGDIQPGDRRFPPGQPGQPGQMQPGQPGGRPGGFPPRPPGPRPMPRPLPRTVTPEPEEHASHGAEHCPGHGPLDAPHAPNWYNGLLGVNNEAATFAKDEHGHLHRSDGLGTQLLYRYNNEKNPCDEKNQEPPFLANLINFGILAFVIYRFGKKPLVEALAARKRTMMQEIDNATRLKREAEERLSEYEDRLQNLDEALAQMKRDYVTQGEAERKHVLAEAEERRLRMKRDVEFRLEQELKTAKAQLLQESVELAVAAAEELLTKKVGAADHERSADDYLAGLSAAWKGDAVKSNQAGGAA